MNVLFALKSGWSRSMHSWKGILYQWVMLLIMTSFIVVPLKGIVRSGFRSSMITERFLNGFDVEAFRDMGHVFDGFIAAMSFGVLFLVLINFLANAFITGGLFESVRIEKKENPENDFWQACAGNFFSFFFIQLLIAIIILFTGLLIIAIPGVFITTAKGIAEKTIFQVMLSLSSVFLLILPVLLLVADYSRAWLVSNKCNSFFKAVGYGFRKTFRTFRSSWLLMVMLIAIQLLFLYICFIVLRGSMPDTGNGVFMFFLISQFLFLFRIFLRVARYGSVTALMENKERPIGDQGSSEGERYYV